MGGAGAHRLRGEAAAGAAPSPAPSRATKCSTSSGMSSARSRSGGTRDRDHREAEVEVLAELVRRATRRRQVAVRGRDHAHVDPDRAAAADARQLALLQHAQQLGLRARAQVADLVEEQRAAVRLLEAAAPGLRWRR